MVTSPPSHLLPHSWPYKYPHIHFSYSLILSPFLSLPSYHTELLWTSQVSCFLILQVFCACISLSLESSAPNSHLLYPPTKSSPFRCQLSLYSSGLLHAFIIFGTSSITIHIATLWTGMEFTWFFGLPYWAFSLGVIEIISIPFTFCTPLGPAHTCLAYISL